MQQQVCWTLTGQGGTASRIDCLRTLVAHMSQVGLASFLSVVLMASCFVVEKKAAV